MTNNQTSLGGLYARWGKQFLDWALALASAAVLVFPMLLIAACIRCFDGAPILFGQERIGRRGIPFRIWKFRTMRDAAGPNADITVAGDPRITKTGRWLRRFKLDELPQLFNVLKGEMSFVGPRPDVPGFADKLEGEALEVLRVRPGITGPATLAFRNEEDLLAQAEDPKRYNDEVIFPEKVRLNLQYARKMSLRADIGYILKTIFPASGHRRSANVSQAANNSEVKSRVSRI